jgi:hypothetical protein
MREYLHTLYQFTDPWVVDDTKYRTAFGNPSTPLDDALAATLQWYRDGGTTTTEPPRQRQPGTGLLPRDHTTTSRHPSNRRDRHDDHPASTARRRLHRPCCPAGHRRLHCARCGVRLPDHPQIRHRRDPRLYRQHQGAVTGWFLVLAVSAALLAPAGIYLGRVAGGSLGRWIAATGIAAATVQVIGLSRWVLFVPGLSDDATDPARTADAHRTVELLHTWLGTILGETIGYALTSTFTVLVAFALTRGLAPRWMTYLGYASAALIATGVIIPLGVEAASLSNFLGYIIWCLWLLALAVILWRPPATAPALVSPLGSTQADRAAGATDEPPPIRVEGRA